MKRRVTLRDIAAKTGYHFTTVSMALRGDLSLPPATRSKIRKVAEAMGYCPDPMVQALSAYRQTCKPPAEHAPLAWLVSDSRRENRPDYVFLTYLKAAQRRARQFGYRIEEFLLNEEGMSPKRMQKVLLARGIKGILVAPQPHGSYGNVIDMNWDAFAAVTFGYTLLKPSLHLITSHHSGSVRILLRKMFHLGYRRIGLYVSRIGSERVSGGWLGGYASEVLSNPKLAWIDPLVYGTADLNEFLHWQRANRLDAVITWSSVIDVVRKSGMIRVPEELGMASLRLLERHTPHAGIDQNEAEIGVTAVDTLLGMLRTNERGLPKVRRNILIEGTWRTGDTVHRRRCTA